MSDEFTKAVCKAVQELYLGYMDGDYPSYYFCESCWGESPPNSTYHGDIVHEDGCIVPLTWEYLNPVVKKLPRICGFNEAWVGICGTSVPCSKHMSILCATSGCIATATHSCEHTSFGVCGVPHCASHGCNHGR